MFGGWFLWWIRSRDRFLKLTPTPRVFLTLGRWGTSTSRSPPPPCEQALKEQCLPLQELKPGFRDHDTLKKRHFVFHSSYCRIKTRSTYLFQLHNASVSCKYVFLLYFSTDLDKECRFRTSSPCLGHDAIKIDPKKFHYNNRQTDSVTVWNPALFFNCFLQHISTEVFAKCDS